MRNCLLVGILLMLVFFQLGCARKVQTDAFLRENIEFSYVRKIAVLPLENNTQDEFVPERLRNVIITQILAMGLFDVVDKGLVDAAFKEEALKKGAPVDLISVKRLGRRLGVQALLVGSVDLSEENRKGAIVFPELGLTLRLLDAKEALVLWQHSDFESGYSVWGRLLGVESRDTFDVAFELVRKMLLSLPMGDEFSDFVPEMGSQDKDTKDK